MDEESISDANNVTADIFSHTSNTQRDNANAILKSENQDKLEKLAEMLLDLTINNAEYYASNSDTASDAQGDLTRDTNTVTYTRNGKEKVTNTSNGNFEQNLLIKRTLPVVIPTMNPRIKDRIAPTGRDSQTLLTSVTKEVVADAGLGGAWVNRTQGSMEAPR